jgi:hypothetical protein
VLTEVVQEGTVLAESVCIGWIIYGRQVVAHQYDETRLDALAQNLAAGYVGFFIE